MRTDRQAQGKDLGHVMRSCFLDGKFHGVPV
jgi:hypothetical protein